MKRREHASFRQRALRNNKGELAANLSELERLSNSESR